MIEKPLVMWGWENLFKAANHLIYEWISSEIETALNWSISLVALPLPPLLQESDLSSGRAQSDTSVGVSGFTPAPRQQFTENNQLSSEMCTTERGLLIPLAQEPNWRTLVILKKWIDQRERVGALRRCTRALTENPNVTPGNRKSHFCTWIRVHESPRARPTRTVLCFL